MAIGVEFVLKASSRAFTKAMAEADIAVRNAKKGLSDLGAGSVLRGAGLFGLVGSIAVGLNAATKAAQDTRAALEKMGEAVPPQVARIARAGDGLDRVKKISQEAFGSVAGWMDRLGHLAGRVVYGAEAAAGAMQLMNDEAQAAKKAAEQAALKEAKGERAQFAREDAMKSGSETDRMNILLKERITLLDKARKATEGTAEHERAMLEVEKNAALLRESEAKIQKEIADKKDAEAKAQEKIAKAATEATEKRKEATKNLVEKFAPTVEDLAEKEIASGVGANDPRRMARAALAEEDKARALFDRGDFKGGLAAAQKAKGLRDSLEMQTSGTGALTPQAAKQAFEGALKDTNGRLEKIEKSLHGLIKAQA